MSILYSYYWAGMILRTENPSDFVGWVETSQASLGSFTISINDLSGAVDLASFKADILLTDILRMAPSEHDHGPEPFTLGSPLGSQWLMGRLERARSPEDFQAELQDAVRSIVKARSVKMPVSNRDHAARSSHGDILNSDADMDITISKHIEALGWEHLVNISSDLRSTTLRLVDSKRREHLVEVSFPRGYPASPPSVAVALPRPLPLAWEQGHRHRGDSRGNSEAALQTRNAIDAMSGNIASDLKGVLRCVESEIKKYEGFIDVLTSIDSRCRVLEPARPSLAICTRRLALDRAGASVTVTIDPDRPHAVCDMAFLGPSSITTPIRSHLQQNVHKWDESLDVVSNLEAVLGVRLPGPLRGGDGAEEEEEEGDTSCAICYSTEDPEAGTSSSHGVKSGPLCSYPDQICPNAKCCRRYHRGCLTSWMQSLPTSRMAFGTLFGACPYCSENMSINLMKT